MIFTGETLDHLLPTERFLHHLIQFGRMILRAAR